MQLGAMREHDFIAHDADVDLVYYPTVLNL